MGQLQRAKELTDRWYQYNLREIGPCAESEHTFEYLFLNLVARPVIFLTSYCTAISEERESRRIKTIGELDELTTDCMVK